MYMAKLAVYNIQWKRQGNLNGDRCHVRLLHVNDKYMYIYCNISEIVLHILPTEKTPTVTNNSDNCFKFIQNVDGKNLTQKQLKLWNRFLFIFIYLLKCKDKSICMYNFVPVFTHMYKIRNVIIVFQCLYRLSYMYGN